MVMHAKHPSVELIENLQYPEPWWGTSTCRKYAYLLYERYSRVVLRDMSFVDTGVVTCPLDCRLNISRPVFEIERKEKVEG
jgi:hypothetical protein